MSMFRGLVAARSLAANSRRFASSAAASAPKNPSNLPFYLIGAGTAGLAAYWYIDHQEKNSVPPQTKSMFDPEKFIDLKLKKVVSYNHDTSRFVFEVPNNEAALLPVASCVIVKSSDPEALKNDKGSPIIRPYTPISQPDLKGEVHFLVKRYDNGNASKHIHGLKEGETLSIKGPIVKFPYKANEFDEVALVGGGSGITPLYQVVTHALADRSNKTKFTLLFCNRTEKDILLREELNDLQRTHPNTFKVVYMVDNPDANWTGPSGFITADIIKKYVAPPSLGQKVKVMICGPPGQVAAVAGKKAGYEQGELGGVLKELGYSEDQVFKF